MPKITKSVIIILIIIFGARTCYYGDPFSSCIYTEKEIPLASFYANAQYFFTKNAEVVRGHDKAFKCLNIMGEISNIIVRPGEGKYYKYQVESPSFYNLSPNPSDYMTAVRLVAVEKHGLTTIDSGRGPIKFLVLKNNDDELFKVALVSLGINKGEEFLKARIGSEEVLLTPNTILEKNSN